MTFSEASWPAGSLQQNTAIPELIVAKLTMSTAFAQCSRQEVARLVPFLREQYLQPGETLCRAGQPASHLWLILQGTLRLKRADASPRDVVDGLVGEEASLGIESYLSDIVAVDHARVVALEREFTPTSLRDRNSRADVFGRALIGSLAPVAPLEAPARLDRRLITPGLAAWKILGWIGSVALLLEELKVGRSLPWAQQQLSAVLASTAMLWIFGVVPPYVAGLLVVFTCVTLGIVPTEVVLSGFASNGFFLALSVFSLGAVLIDSGVIGRAFLLLIRRCPRSSFAYDLAAALAGVLLTPVVPSVLDRARVLGPIAAESVQTLDYDGDTRQRMRLALSAFMGVTLFSPMLLTGGPLNLILYGSLPEQVQDAFSWTHWVEAALVASLVMTGAFLAAYFYFFHKSPSLRDPRPIIAAQLDVLGPVRSREWLAVGGALVFLVAVATVSAHKIDHRLIALTVVCGYLVLGSLGKDQLNLHIDWSGGLILLGALIGIIATIIHVGLHETVGAHLVELDQIMRYHPRVFIALLAASVVLAGLFVPSAGALIAVCALPLAIFNGVNPWVVTFVILLMSDVWFLPYQSAVYRVFRDSVRSETPLDERLFLRFNAAMAVARVVALAASVVYWEKMRVL